MCSTDTEGMAAMVELEEMAVTVDWVAMEEEAVIYLSIILKMQNRISTLLTPKVLEAAVGVEVWEDLPDLEDPEVVGIQMVHQVGLEIQGKMVPVDMAVPMEMYYTFW